MLQTNNRSAIDVVLPMMLLTCRSAIYHVMTVLTHSPAFEPKANLALSRLDDFWKACAVGHHVREIEGSIICDLAFSPTLYPKHAHAEVVPLAWM